MATFSEVWQAARQFLGQRQWAQAESLYRELVAAKPQAAELWHELGLAQLQGGQSVQACESLAQAVQLDPTQAGFLSNLGAAYRQTQRPREAAAAFERALALAVSPELYNNWALALKDAGDEPAALAAFDQALLLKPDYANGHFNRANLLLAIGRIDDAVDGYQRTIALAPGDAGAHCKLGIARHDLGQLDRALGAFEQALALAPDYSEARRNRAVTWLAQGNYAQGWAEFEHRFECDDMARFAVPRPHWQGEPLPGRTLWIHAEQGLGDMLQFVRYLPLVEAAGGIARFAAPAALVPILSASGIGKYLVGTGNTPHADWHAPLMSLGRFLPNASGRPYWPGNYLKADPALVSKWRDRLSGVAGFKVGIIWSGNPGHAADRFRSVRLAQWAPLAQVPGVRLISLQRGDACEELSSADFPVIDWTDELDRASGPFMDSAALMQQLDLVISVDTATAHLAGGLGVPVWVALQFAPDWRWTFHGTETPWYPTMRLFRQQVFGDWNEVFANMTTALLTCQQSQPEA